ncbi:MAG: hypothetical protein FWD67_07615 [Betaproteobacteria bacterium]|nr:hypothetical protein [Betaproteobacteria bacterium]
MNDKKYWKYWVFTSLAMFIILPVLLNVVAIPLVVGFFTFSRSPWVLLVGVLSFLLLAYVISLFGKKATLPDAFLSRYGPLIVPILFTLTVWLLITSVNGGNFSKGGAINRGLLVFLPYTFISFPLVISSGTYWIIPVLSITSYLFFTACFAIGTWQGKRFRTTENKPALPVLALILVLASIATVQGYAQYRSALHSDPDHPELQGKHQISK